MKAILTSLICLVVSGGLRCTKELMDRRAPMAENEVIVTTFAGSGIPGLMDSTALDIRDRL